jgi:excisionase family DNA binding protein
MLPRLKSVAKEIGISYPTLKQWIYQRKIRTVKTAGGHHRIAEEELQRLLGIKTDRSQDEGSREEWTSEALRAEVHRNESLLKGPRSETFPLSKSVVETNS